MHQWCIGASNFTQRELINGCLMAFWFRNMFVFAVAWRIKVNLMSAEAIININVPPFLLCHWWKGKMKNPIWANCWISINGSRIALLWLMIIFGDFVYFFACNSEAFTHTHHIPDAWQAVILDSSRPESVYSHKRTRAHHF
jgi:hypothetical protein